MSATRQVTVTRPFVSTLGLLGVLFVALKLTGVISWSWWLVLLPFYAGLALAALAVVIGLIIVLAVAGAEKLEDKKRRARYGVVRR